MAAAREQFGSWTLAELEGAADDVAAWRAGLSDTSRYRKTLAFRQALNAAVRWRYLTVNPVAQAGTNPQPRTDEFLPLSREQIDVLDAELGAVHGPLVVFAAETGLRTNEWAALERRDVDQAGRAVAVQRRVSDGVVTPYPKTERSRRRVPLTARALDAYRRLPARLDTPLVFPAPQGGYLVARQLADARVVRRPGRDRYRAARPVPPPPHVRHQGARRGYLDFELARVMGASVREIDRTYGHLARDSEDTIRARLDARAGRSGVFLASGKTGGTDG